MRDRVDPNVPIEEVAGAIKVIWSGINIFRFECGVVAESWSEVSDLDPWRHLGIVDAPGATPVP